MAFYYLKRKKKTKEKPLPLFDGKVKVEKKPDMIAKVDRTVSKYVRHRDSKEYGFKYFKCVSCGRILPIEQADCGHYFSRTKMSVRFDEDNVHAECRACNRFRADHLIGYRENLIKKIGIQRFELLSWKASQTRKWCYFELVEINGYFEEKDRALTNGT
jgi:5-methylcytosine-specific restriction endonuclease McrA